MQHRLEAMLDRRVVLGDDAGSAPRACASACSAACASRARVDRDRRAGVEPDAAHAAGARRAPEARLPRPLARLARRAAAHRRTSRRASLDARARAPRRRPRLVAVRQEEGRAGRAARTRRCRPSAGSRVGDGHVLYVDEVLPAGIDARFALSDGSARRRLGAPRGARPPRSGAAPAPRRRCGECAAAAASSSAPAAPRAARKVAERVRARAGRERPAPEGGRPVPQAAGAHRPAAPPACSASSSEGARRRRSRCRCARVGRAELSFDGSTTDPLHFTGLKGRFSVAGPSLGAVGDALGITLPTTPPFKTHGTLVKDGGLWKAVFDDGEHRQSRLDGAFTYDKRPQGAAAVRPARRLAPAARRPRPGGRRARRRASRRSQERRSDAAAASSRTASSTCRRCARWTPTS